LIKTMNLSKQSCTLLECSQRYILKLDLWLTKVSRRGGVSIVWRLPSFAT
jgi:hypothetical protein